MHRMTTPEGLEFTLELDDAGRISRVNGPVPEAEGAEFELHGALPDHAPIDDVPRHILDLAAARGRHVCVYDPAGCVTCFCDDDGNTLYCHKMC